MRRQISLALKRDAETLPQRAKNSVISGPAAWCLWAGFVQVHLCKEWKGLKAVTTWSMSSGTAEKYRG